MPRKAGQSGSGSTCVDSLRVGLSGTELISRLRRHNTTVPIIVLTAREAVDDKVKNFEAGADDYLTKPFAFAELLVRIKALLETRAGESLQFYSDRGTGDRGACLGSKLRRADQHCGCLHQAATCENRHAIHAQFNSYS